MGWGDVKFSALLGVVLGIQLLLLGLYLGILIGGIVGIGALLARGLGARRTLIPLRSQPRHRRPDRPVRRQRYNGLGKPNTVVPAGVERNIAHRHYGTAQHIGSGTRLE